MVISDDSFIPYIDAPTTNCLPVEKSPIQKEEQDEEDENDLPCDEFDDILDVIGSQGRFQKMLLYAIVCPITALEPFLTLNMIFLLYQPDHWCYIPGRDPNITSLEDWKGFHIPLDYSRTPSANGEIKFSQCTMYSDDNTIIKCPFGWEYDKVEYESTIATAFNWVCEDGSVPTDAFSASALGNAFGTMIFGHLADKVGRKPIFFLTILINVGFRISSFFVAHSVYMFHISNFLVGTAFPLMFIAPSMIAAEVSDKDYRGWVYAVTWMIWVVGMSGLPFVVWICREWFTIGLATSLPGALLFLYWFHLPESPRWLFSVGRLDESSRILMRIAKFNGREDQLTKVQLDSTLARLYNLQPKNETRTGVWTLFSKKRLAKNTTLLTLCWSINIVVYYGITLNTTHMSGNQFVNFFLLSIIEFPSGLMGAYLVDTLGRRWTQVMFFCGCTAATVASAAVVQFLKDPVLEIVAVVVAKFAITLTFLVVYLQGAELFPTQLRSTGSGFASTVGAAFGIFGPIIVALGEHNLSYPYWIMAVLCTIGMIAASFLPETLKQRLPESLEDADKFGEGNKFWSISVRKDSSYLKQASLMRRQSLATNRNMANHVDNGKK